MKISEIDIALGQAVRSVSHPMSDAVHGSQPSILIANDVLLTDGKEDDSPNPFVKSSTIIKPTLSRKSSQSSLYSPAPTVDKFLFSSFKSQQSAEWNQQNQKKKNKKNFFGMK